jgi:hypothetical protein
MNGAPVPSGAPFFCFGATVAPHSNKPVPSSRERMLGLKDPSATSRLRPSTLRSRSKTYCGLVAGGVTGGFDATGAGLLAGAAVLKDDE